MSNLSVEMEIVRKRIANIERDLKAEIEAIQTDAISRTLAAVRSAERAAAPLRSILSALETAGMDQTDSSANIKLSGTRSTKPRGTTTGSPPRDGAAVPEKEKVTGRRVEGIPHPVSARHLILSILQREGTPLPFPALDHAVIEAGWTRSAGEKSRRTMVQAGIVDRVDNMLIINDRGREELSRFNVEDKS